MFNVVHLPGAPGPGQPPRWPISDSIKTMVTNHPQAVYVATENNPFATGTDPVNNPYFNDMPTNKWAKILRPLISSPSGNVRRYNPDPVVNGQIMANVAKDWLIGTYQPVPGRILIDELNGNTGQDIISFAERMYYWSTHGYFNQLNLRYWVAVFCPYQRNLLTAYDTPLRNVFAFGAGAALEFYPEASRYCQTGVSPRRDVYLDEFFFGANRFEYVWNLSNSYNSNQLVSVMLGVTDHRTNNGAVAPANFIDACFYRWAAHGSAGSRYVLQVGSVGSWKWAHRDDELPASDDNYVTSTSLDASFYDDWQWYCLQGQTARRLAIPCT